MKNKKSISEAELQMAIQKFLKDGGIINKLPDQKTASSRQVGMKYDITESGGESLG